MMKCRAVVNITGAGFGKSLGPGTVADLDEVIGQHNGKAVLLGDVVREDWFEQAEVVVADEAIEEEELG